MKLAYLAFSDKGYKLAQDLAAESGGQAFRSGQQDLQEWTREHFAADDGLVFVGAAGIAVRAIAPYVKDKTRDPAVVVMDERGLNVIPILSGHLGGANDLARRLSKISGANCVITTATDINGVFAVDEWSKRQDCALLESERIVKISGAILGGGEVTVRSPWPIKGEVPAGLRLTEGRADITLDVVSDDEDTLHIVPRICVLGIGCRKGTTKAAIEKALEKFESRNGFLRESVYAAASIDLKKNEKGLLEFCSEHGWPIEFYSSDELAAAAGSFSASEMVKSVTGVDNVCERSAVVRSGGRIIIKKMAADGVTLAAAVKEYEPDWEWKNE